MDSFDLKSKLRCAFSFTATDGSDAEPTSATVTINYPRANRRRYSERIPLTKNPASGLWIGFWDSSKAVDGEVDWSVECAGALVGAQKGSFLLEGNRAYPLPPLRS